MANTNDMNTPTKVPCGGFVLGEGLALGEDGKTLNVSGGGQFWRIVQGNDYGYGK